MLSLNLIQNCRSLLSAKSGAVCIGSLILALSGAAQAETLVTGPSPFASCSADNVSTQPGTNYPAAEVEPWVDADPTNARHLIAGWQQDRWSNGGSRGLVSGYSNDGGVTWTTVVVPGISLCSDGIFERARFC